MKYIVYKNSLNFIMKAALPLLKQCQELNRYMYIMSASDFVFQVNLPASKEEEPLSLELSTDDGKYL